MKKTPVGKIPTIKPQTPFVRAVYCRKFLYLSGFLTEAENSKVGDRITKWNRKMKTQGESNAD